MRLSIEVAHSTAFSVLELDPMATVTEREAKESSLGVCREEDITLREHREVSATAALPVRHLQNTN